jgi:hypothetical protein
MNVLKDTIQRDTSSTNPLSNNSDTNADLMVTLIDKLDGGGIEIMSNPKSLRNMLERRPDLYVHKCEAYILGMVCYGSYFPLQPIIGNHQKIKERTLVPHPLSS